MLENKNISEALEEVLIQALQVYELEYILKVEKILRKAIKDIKKIK